MPKMSSYSTPMKDDRSRNRSISTPKGNRERRSPQSVNAFPDEAIVDPEESPYATLESHHFIKFRTNADTKPAKKKNVMSRARNAIKKRMESKEPAPFQKEDKNAREVETSLEHRKIETSIDGQVVTRSKLKTGDRGRTMDRVNSFSNGLRRSLSRNRSGSTDSRKHKSGDSVCSASNSVGSSRSLANSVKLMGGNIKKRVKSFRDRSVDSRGSRRSRGSRASRSRRRNRKNKNNSSAGNVVFVKQTYTPDDINNYNLKRQISDEEESDARVFSFNALCASLDDIQDYVCGIDRKNDDEEDELNLIGKVIGLESDDPRATPVKNKKNHGR